MTHQTFGALSPAISGTDQVRGFTISGNRLTLRPPTSANGNQRSLTWERVPDLPNLTPTHRKLIGFWKLISLERRNAKGELLSSNPGMTGFIVYTASGHVMVHMMQPYRRRNVGADADAGRDDGHVSELHELFRALHGQRVRQVRRPPPRRRDQFGQCRDRLSTVLRVFGEETDPEAAGHEGQQRAGRADDDHLGTAE